MSYLDTVTKANATVWVDVTSGVDATGIIGRSDRPFRTIDAANMACTAASITGIVTMMLSFGRHTRVRDEHPRWRDNADLTLRPTVRDNTRMIGSGRPLPKADRTGLDETTGTVIDGSFICQRVNFQTESLGIDSGQEVCARLWAGAAQEAFVMAYYGQPSYLVGEIPRPGHRHMNVAGMCQSSNAAVHAALFENLLSPSVDTVYTYYGTHGSVFKVTGGTVRNLYNHGHGGEGTIIKGSPYAACQQLLVSNIQCRTMLPVGATTGAIGNGLQLYGGEDNVLLSHVRVDGVIAFQTGFALDIVGGGVPATGNTSGNVADCEVNGLIGVGNTGFGVRGRNNITRFGLQAVILNPTGIGVDVDDPGILGMRIDATVTAATGDGLKVGGTRTRLLKVVAESNGGAGVRNSSVSTEINVRGFTGNALGDMVGTPMIDTMHIQAIRTLTATGALLTTDGYIKADATSGPATLTLPGAASGLSISVKKIDSTGNPVTVAAAGGQLIDGAAVAVLTFQYNSFTLVSDGTNWMVF